MLLAYAVTMVRYEEERKHCVCVKCQQEINYIGDKPQIIENAALGFSEFFTVYDYEGKIKNIVVGFKDGKKAYLAEYIAKMLYDVYSQKEIKADCVAYTPCSPQKTRQRGFDPMKLVAEKFAELSSLKITHCLERSNKGLDQTESADRYKNIKGLFYAAKDKKDTDIKGKTIILIDDVITTGATASECCKVLKQCGAGKIILLTLAQAASFERYKTSFIPRNENKNMAVDN